MASSSSTVGGTPTTATTATDAGTGNTAATNGLFGFNSLPIPGQTPNNATTPQPATPATPAIPSTPSTGTDLSSFVPTTPTINASTLPTGNNTDVQVPPAPTDQTNSIINGLVTGSTSTGLPSESTLVQNQNTAQGNVDQTTSQINDLLTQLGYKASDTANLESQANLPGLQNNLSDLTTQLAQKKAQYDAQFQAIGSQNIPSLFMSGQMALAKAGAASDLGATAALVQAAQGNLNTAFDTINKTISLKYQPIIDQIDAQQKFYAINKDALTNAQTLLANRQNQILDLQKTAITNQQKVLSDAATSINQSIQSGLIDPTTGWSVYADLLSGKITPSDAFAKLGVSAPASVQQPADLASAISSVESGFEAKPYNATNPSGALGKYQIMPKYWFATIGLDPNSQADQQKFLNSPALQDSLFQSIISTLSQQYGGDQNKVIAAYFGGDVAAKAYGTPAGDKITDGNLSVNQYVNQVVGKLNEQQQNTQNNQPVSTGNPAADAILQNAPTFNGQKYVAATSLPKGKMSDTTQLALEKAGYTPLQPDEVKALDSITSAQNILSGFNNFFTSQGLLPANWQDQPAQYADVKLNSILQTDSDLQAFNTWKLSIISTLSALKGVGGGGGGASRLYNSLGGLFPEPTDTLTTAQQKIQNINQQLNDVGAPIIGTNGQKGQSNNNTLSISGNTYTVGQAYTNSKGQTAVLNADGTWTPQ